MTFIKDIRILALCALASLTPHTPLSAHTPHTPLSAHTPHASHTPHAPLSAQVQLTIDASRRGPAIGPRHYGIFYEEINNAGDGGLYGELLRNRSFETNGTEYWTATEGATIAAMGTDLMNTAQKGAMQLTMTGSGQGTTNTGYWGIQASQGDTYRFSMWVKADASWSGTATFSLKNKAGELCAQGTADISAGTNWQKVEGTMTASASDPDCTFSLTFSKAGSLQLDMVSLFPPTFKNRDNGCRLDLANLLDAMHPKFVRFPGGCYIEGYGTAESPNRFEWKKTVGPVEQRPGHYNHNWGYPCTDGLGYHEFLQLSEDLGAEPLFVVNIGLGHFWAQDYTDIDEYIQEALDAIEYANGDASTPWGALRAAAGHPEPFNLRLIEIGNENYNYDPSDLRFDHYAERYKAFYDAIKARHPEITLIGNVEAWGTDTPSWRNPHPVEMVDEHYYRTPGWFELNYNKYDSYDRTGPKIYVGEYAVTEPLNEVKDGTLRSALGEAVYMLGMERNSDVVVMNSYAPIFYHEERGGGWLPDMIRFNHSTSYGTPSYHVQSMMANTLGQQNLLFNEENNQGSLGNMAGLSTWSTRAAYDNVTITDANGTILFSDDFSSSLDKWTLGDANWSLRNDMLYQASTSAQGAISVANATLPATYTFECDAMKISGNEGFLVAFNYGDANNYCWWNIGGWNNSQHGLQYCKNGTKSDYDLKPGSIATNRTYHIKIEVDGLNAKCYLDGELIHNVTFPATRKLYFASAINDDNNTMILKVVNTQGASQPLTIRLANGSFTGSADVQVLTSASDLDTNTASNPANVAPDTGSMQSVEGATATYEVPAYSLSIITLGVSDIPAPQERITTWSNEQKAQAEAALGTIGRKLANLHASTALPVSIKDATVEWWMSTPATAVNVAGSLYSSTLEIIAPNESASAKECGTIAAEVTFTDGGRGTLEFPVRLAAADDAAGYILAAPASTGGLALATASLGSLGKKFSMQVASTPLEGSDSYTRINLLRTDAGYLATAEAANATDTEIFKSTDMIHWQKAASLKGATSATLLNTDNGIIAIYLSADGKISYTKLAADLSLTGTPTVIEAGGLALTNPTATVSEYDRLVHIFATTATAGEVAHLTIATDGTGLVTAEPLHPTSEAISAIALTRRAGEDMHSLYLTTASAMKACDADFDFTKPGELFNIGGITGIMNGNVMTITETEASMLNLWRIAEAEVAKAKEAQAAGNTLYDSALALAETVMSTPSTTEALNEKLPAVIAAFADAKAANLTKDDPEGFNDITSLLVNPDFRVYNNDGWSGTTFTAVNAGVAEHFDKNFDTYQILENMPAGIYRLEASGFYRYGSKNYSYTAHQDGYEQLYGMLYINTAGTPLVSLHSEGYTLADVPDNVWSANSAFNTSGKYAGNRVEFSLAERGTLRVGVKKTEAMADDWTCFDNFKLYYKNTAAGVAEINLDNDGNAAPEYYNLQGMRIIHPTPGIYIVRRGASVSKEYVR